MIRSMTGYGRYESQNEDAKLIAEIKSVNHRYCDISIRLPKNLNAFEQDIRNQVRAGVSRGKIDVYITYESKREGTSLVTYNRDMARSYVELVTKMADEFGLANELDAQALSLYPEVFSLKEAAVDEEKMQELVRQTVAGAMEHFIRARETEGELLKRDLFDKLDLISGVTDEIAARCPDVFREYRERLTSKVEELLGNTQLDDAVIATELVVYADKICIDEELVRLKSHIRHMKETLQDGESVGRKLDFIAQELNREANTTLSKANDGIICNQGIRLKTEIEKIREQIQNLE